MSVRVRAVQDKENVWEVDIRVQLPDGMVIRERREAPVSGKANAQRWARDREIVLVRDGKPKRAQLQKEVPTLKEFATRFIDGYVRANRHKLSGIAGKESIIRCHLVPALGDKQLDSITTEDVQRL